MSHASERVDWGRYISRASESKANLIDYSTLIRQIDERSSLCFSQDLHVRIVDLIHGGDGQCAIYNERDAAKYQAGKPKFTQFLYHSVASVVEAESKIKEAIKPRVRIILIDSKRTIAPLRITPELMLDILVHYAVPIEFLPIILSFGKEPHMAEGSSSFFNLQESPGNVKRISYQIRYVEENRRQGQDPWSLRHTGIYHFQSVKFDLLLVLQPIRDSSFEKQILNLENINNMNTQIINEICSNPLSLHSMIINSYDNWRWYFQYLGDQFEEKNDLALTQDIDVAGRANLNFECVQYLRHLHDVLLSARACCKGNLRVATELLKLRRSSSGGFAGIQIQTSQLPEHIESADVLQSRIRNAIDIIGYSLNMRAQTDAFKIHEKLHDMTEQLRDMAKDTVDDSLTVKILAFVSAVYLPGSFVATIFGMNFFDFESDSESNRTQINVTDDLWIFIAVWLPLTILTGVVYRFLVVLNNRKKAMHDFSKVKRINSEHEKSLQSSNYVE